MTLKDFIAETLVQLVAGVQEAQQAVPERGARINPTYGSKTGGAFTREVQFDLALSMIDGRVAVVVGGRGSTDLTDSASTGCSRVRFSVPVDFPEHRISQ